MTFQKRIIFSLCEIQGLPHLGGAGGYPGSKTLVSHYKSCAGETFYRRRTQSTKRDPACTLAYSAVNTVLRSHTLSTFPYSYQYHISDEEQIIITGLYHHSRNPTIWRKTNIE
jgi:hypothetical protein